MINRFNFPQTGFTATPGVHDKKSQHVGVGGLPRVALKSLQRAWEAATQGL